MEATEKSIGEQVEKDKPLSGVSTKILEALGIFKDDRHMTVSRIAKASGCDARGVGPALAALVRKGMVIQRENPETGEVSWHLPGLVESEKIEKVALAVLSQAVIGAPAFPCPIDGCHFVGANEHALAVHKGRSHKEDPEDDDEEEDDKPEVLTQASPDLQDLVELIEDFGSWMKEQGWHVELQIKVDNSSPSMKGGS